MVRAVRISFPHSLDHDVADHARGLGIALLIEHVQGNLWAMETKPVANGYQDWSGN